MAATNVVGASKSPILAAGSSKAQGSPAVAANSESKLMPGLLAFGAGGTSSSSSAAGQKKPQASKTSQPAPLLPFDSFGKIKDSYDAYVAARKDSAAASKLKSKGLRPGSRNISELEGTEINFPGAIFKQI